MNARRGRLGVVSAIAVSLLFVLTPSSSHGQGPVTVKASAVSTHWSVNLPVAVALAKGYWRDEGLNVQFSVVGPGSAHLQAFAGGSFQFSVNLNADVMARAASHGARIHAISGSTNHNQYTLYARGGIKTLADLRGKRIAIDTPGGSHDTFVQEILSTVGMKATDVVLIPVAGAIEVRVNAMLSGATDAAIGSIAQWPSLRDQGITIVYRLRDLHPAWQTAVNGVRADLLERNPTAVKRFLKGMIRAFQFLKDPRNEPEVGRIAREQKMALTEQRFSEELSIQREFWPADGGLDLKGTEIVLQREREAGLITKEFTLEKFVRLVSLREAQRELGLRK